MAYEEQEPIVTIITATYNGAETIRTALSSIQAQTFPDYEVIVVDDASTDGTVKMITPFLSDPRFTLVQNDTNIGQTASFNKAFRMARGKYLCYLDDDNEWYPHNLACLTAGLESNPEVHVAHGGRLFIGYWTEQGETIEVERRYEPPLELRTRDVWLYRKQDYFYKPFIDTNNIFIRKKSLKAIGHWDENLSRKPDWELTMRIIEKYPDGIVTIPKVVTKYNFTLGDKPGGKETAYDFGYIYYKYRNHPLLRGQEWWPHDVTKKRMADRYKVLADTIRGYSLDERSGKEIAGLILTQPQTEEEWIELISKHVPGVQKYLPTQKQATNLLNRISPSYRR